MRIKRKFIVELVIMCYMQLTPVLSTSNNSNTSQHHLSTINKSTDRETSRQIFSDSTINKISETLGVLNHVGHFLVDMTRGGSIEPSTTTLPTPSITPPPPLIDENSDIALSAVLSDSSVKRADTNEPSFGENKKKKKKKNKITKLESVGTKVTVAPSIILKPTNTPFEDNVTSKESENRCRTPDGKNGKCEDLSSCPALLLNLNGLRESLCFKTLFVPGVCCPIQEEHLSIKPSSTTTAIPNLVLIPQNKTTTTTKRPLIYPHPYPVTQPSNDLSDIVDKEQCGQQEHSAGRIVGGIEAQSGQWPWLAAIFLHGPKRTEFWCGGSLIDDRHILTAAHCTKDSRQKTFAARQFTVRLGDIDLSTDLEASDPVSFGVKEVRVHEKYLRLGFYNDIAILVLDKPVRKSKYIIPLCLPKNNNFPPKHQLIGKRGTIAGWGTTYYGGKESSIQKQADVPIWRNDDCNNAYFQTITENFLCAGYSDGGIDACQGDSGGPLMMRVESKWTQLGVVSFGNKCGEPGSPGVYTRVSQYLDWIREKTKS